MKCAKCKINERISRSYCLSCKNAMDLASYHKNKEKRTKYIKEYKAKNPEYKKRSNEICKLWRKNNPEYIKNWMYNKIKTDINYKIRHNVTERLRVSLKKNSKGAKTIELLGCTIEKFKEYLESKFSKNMTWENYGRYGWHIDHIIPCYHFDLSKIEEQKKCFHYTNLQPLWAKDNLTKNRNKQ